MKELTFIIGIGAILIALIYSNNSAFSERCRASGGVPYIGKYDNICYAPGVAIDVD